MGHSKYYIVEADDLIEKANRFRAAYIEQQKRFWEFVETNGGDAYQTGFNDRLIGIRFPDDKRPAGWCKPKSYRGVSYPMKKSDWREKLFDVGQLPQIADYFPDLVDTPNWISFEGPKSKGGTRIGNGFQPIQLCWYSEDSPLMLMLPDVERALREVKIDHPDATTQGDIEQRKPPAGLREILIEEWNLMVAKHKQLSEAA